MVFISRNTAKEQSFSLASSVLTSVLYGLTACVSLKDLMLHAEEQSYSR